MIHSNFTKTILVSTFTAIFVAGCGPRSYVASAGADRAEFSTAGRPTRIVRGDIEFDLRAIEDRVRLTIVNRSARPVELLNESRVTSPQGRSMSIPAATIGPSGFHDILLPPRPPAPPRDAEPLEPVRSGASDDSDIVPVAITAGPAINWNVGDELAVQLVYRIGLETFTETIALRRTQ